VLLLDDEDVLSAEPDEAEARLASRLSNEIALIDERILCAARAAALKIARVVHDALKAGGFDPWDDGVVELHTRRVIGLIQARRLEAAGNPYRPRFSEVWLREELRG
jgi:hypothetical protein